MLWKPLCLKHPEMVDIFQTIRRDYTPTTEADFADSSASVPHGLLATRWMTTKNQALSIHHLTQGCPILFTATVCDFAQHKTLPTVHQRYFEIVATLQTVDVKSLFQQHGISTPVIHFTNLFRSLRQDSPSQTGVYYTASKSFIIIHTT